MELTVLVNEQEKNVSGITEDTTCSDIIYALAHSSGQKGKFVLVAHINGMEYKFFPQEKPLSVIKCDKISNKPIHTTFELRNVSSYSTDPSKHNQIQNNNNVISKAQTLSRPNHSTHNNGEAIYSHHQILRPVMLGHQNTTNIQQHPNSGNSNVVRNIVTGLNSLERPPPPAYTELINKKYSSLPKRCETFGKRHSSLFDYATDNNNTRHLIRNDHNNIVDTTASNEIIPFGSTSNGHSIDTNLKTSFPPKQSHESSNKLPFLQPDQLRFSPNHPSNQSEEEKELLQLIKQKSNLDAVLDQFRSQKYEERLLQSKNESKLLEKEILSTQTQISDLKSQLKDLKSLHIKLEDEIQLYLDKEKDPFYSVISKPSTLRRQIV